MSWTQQPQGGPSPPGLERRSYASPRPQLYNNQQSLYQNYQTTATNSQQQLWPRSQQHQYSQQYGQGYQQDVTGNANQYYQSQPSQYNQSYNQYDNSQPVYGQNNYQNNPITQQSFPQKTNPDTNWEENWDWGWDDASKQAQKQQNIVSQQINSQQVFNNANVIEESFASSDNWNWSIEDKKTAKESTQTNIDKNPAMVSGIDPQIENSVTIETINQKSLTNTSLQSEDMTTLKDSEVIKEQLPNLALGKRLHLDNLTPQWSIESQMSQESSDGPQTHSEGTYKSENQSTDSNKSIPGSNTDSSNFNYSQPAFDEYQNNSAWLKSDDHSLSIQNGSRQQIEDDLASSIQEMTLENYKNPLEAIHKSETIHEDAPPPPVTPPNISTPGLSNHPVQSHPILPPPLLIQSVSPPVAVALPRPPSASGSLPRPPSSSGSLTRPPSSSGIMPPPAPLFSHNLRSSSSTTLLPPPSTLPAQSSCNSSIALSSLSTSLPQPNLPPPAIPTSNIPPPSSSSNPFKHGGSFSHKTTTKANLTMTSMQFSPHIPNTSVVAQTVNKMPQQRIPVGFEANLETTPDNSERPDQPQLTDFRSMPLSQQIPENLEVAPQNDRNEYLQTAHLSCGGYGQNTDFSRNVPPPGLCRMVVGQQETEYRQNLNISGDEPPPGLARMVPGQQTETENIYNQSGSNYMDRQIDGQPTDNTGRPYRQADGQLTLDNYAQSNVSTGNERRPIGLDRMVPGESSNIEYSQYQSSNYGGNEERVVTGVDHNFSMKIDAGPSDVREQNVDGSDYTEQSSRNPPRNVRSLETSSNIPPDFGGPPDDQQREIIMEGENLQDISNISSAELTFSREQIMDGADELVSDLQKTGNDGKIDLSDSVEHPITTSRKQSMNRVNTSGEESERDRTYKSSPRRDGDKHKSSRERDRDRDRDRGRDKEGRYSRGDRKYDRDERKSGRTEKDRRDRERERRDRGESPDGRRHRRSNRSHRYETEDTDYYSDKEREHRRYREGSYASRPPRREDKDRRGDERDKSRRYNTIERDRRYDDEWDGGGRSRRSAQYLRYRDIDPSKKYGSLRKDREDDRRRGDQFSSPSRPESRDATVTDDDLNESRRRTRRHPRPDPYYDGYGAAGGYAEGYALQPQQYQYYELLRMTDPEAYMQVYKQVMAGHPPPAPPPHLYAKLLRDVYGEGYSSLAYDGRLEKRGGTDSVHSGRSSTTGLKGNDTDLNTDASLNLHLEESTVRSERMTPFRYSTAHIKGSVASQHLVLVRGSYPVDGRPATVQLLSLQAALAHDPLSADLAAYPGPLLKGVSHKKSVIEYCEARVRSADADPDAARDPVGYTLVWEFLALLLRQNGVVVGSDIAELLMKNTREYEYRPAAKPAPYDEELRASPDQLDLNSPDVTRPESSTPGQPAMDEKAALDKLREYLICGNRQEALEWAMCQRLWGHAMQLAAHGDRRARATVAARFLAAQPRTDPLHTLYAALAGMAPPACVSEERWGDWRPHAAILLANSSQRPDHDRKTLTQLGDSLSSRGLIYSAQFCYVSAGMPFAPHPLAPLQLRSASTAAAPPRLSLLLADPRASSLNQFATNKAIFATEIYEYALSLSQDYVITDLQVYKVVAAARLCDCGQYERALAYAEHAARAVMRAPTTYSPVLARVLADLADRLKYHDPALQQDASLQEEPDSAEPSPRHHQQWIDDVRNVAHLLTAQQYQPVQSYPELVEETPDYSTQYYSQAAQQIPQHVGQQFSQQTGQQINQQTPQQISQQSPQQVNQQDSDPNAYPSYGEDWHTTEEHHAQSYADPYWQPDSGYGYGEAGGEEPGESRPAITMPGAPTSKSAYLDHDDEGPASGQRHGDRTTDSPNSTKTDSKPKEELMKSEGGKARGGGGWLGGIFAKISLRPPNQMVLPDDKNPSIVWDEDKKRWRNVDGDTEEAERPPPPPPRAADLQPLMRSGSPPLQGTPGAPPAAPLSNIFKMQKGRHIKKSYVDVFNPSGAPTRALPPAAEVLGPANPALHPAGTPSPLTYFVPAPAPSQSGIYDPSQVAGEDDQYRSGI